MGLGLARVAYGILGLAFKTAILLVGAAVLVGLVFNEANGPPRDQADTRLVRDSGGRIIVALEDDKNTLFSKFVISDKNNYPLICGKVYQNKRIDFSLGDDQDEKLVRSVGYTTTAGDICLALRNGRCHYKLSASIDGSTLLEVTDLEQQIQRRFRVMPEGDFTTDSPIVIGDKANGLP